MNRVVATIASLTGMVLTAPTGAAEIAAVGSIAFPLLHPAWVW
jgi:hypothetical protein